MQFEKNANELEKIMYWRNMKMNILLGLIAVSAICYIGLKFI